MRTLVDCLMGRFALTNHIYIQITQPGSTVTPMYQYRRRRKIRLIESKAKCNYLKNLPLKGLCGRGSICLRPLPPMTPPLFYTLYTCTQYTYLLFTQGRGEGGMKANQREVRGAIIDKASRKHQHD